MIGGWGRRGMRYSVHLTRQRSSGWSSNRLGRLDGRWKRSGIPRSSVYRWYDRYQRGGPEALADRPSRPDRVWNRIPKAIRNQIVDLARWINPNSARGNWRCASRTRKNTLSQRRRLSASKSTRSHHQPGLHRDQSGRDVQGSRPRSAQPALADRLHLSQDHGLGLVTISPPRRLTTSQRFIVACRSSARL